MLETSQVPDVWKIIHSSLLRVWLYVGMYPAEVQEHFCCFKAMLPKNVRGRKPQTKCNVIVFRSLFGGFAPSYYILLGSKSDGAALGVRESFLP